MQYNDIVKRDFKDKMDLFLTFQILSQGFVTAKLEEWSDFYSNFEEKIKLGKKKEWFQYDDLIEYYNLDLIQKEFSDHINAGASPKIKKMTVQEFEDIWGIWEENFLETKSQNRYSKSYHLQFSLYYDQFKKYFKKKILSLEIFSEKNAAQQCYYCGIKSNQIEILRDNKLIKTKRRRGFIMEIDQKEPNLGYQENNIVQCCYWCNNAKTDEFSAKEFIEIAQGINHSWNKRLKSINAEPVPFLWKNEEDI